MPKPLRERPPQAVDPILYLAFPAYYLVMVGYGVFAAIYYLPSVAAATAPTFAQLFGVLVAVTSLLCLVTTLRSLFTEKPIAEFVATILVLVLMFVYTSSIYYSAILMPDGRTRPGSLFIPLLFSVFPFARVLVIARSGRMHR